MQYSTAEKYDFDIPDEDNTKERKEDMSAVDSAPDMENQAQSESVTIQTITIDESFTPKFATRSGFAYVPEKVQSLVPCVALDIIRHTFTYVLVLTACALALFKIYQAQETRTMIAKHYDLTSQVEVLQNEYQTLCSERQVLSEDAKIRMLAETRLGMVSPKTDEEIVLRLDR